MVSASSAPATQLTSTPSVSTEPIDSTMPKVSASSGVDAAARDRPAGGARHAGVDVGVVPHVERARGAGADGDAEDGDDGRARDADGPGAATRPASAVNTTSDITRGFISATIVADAAAERAGVSLAPMRDRCRVSAMLGRSVACVSRIAAAAGAGRRPRRPLSAQ